MKNGAKNVHQGTVLECRKEKPGSETVILRLKIKKVRNFKPQAGQFVTLAPGVKTSVMSRPITIFDIIKDELILGIRPAGENTKAYAQLKKGEKIKFIGPLGKGIAFNSKKGRCIFVAGGIASTAIFLPVKKAIKEGREVSVYLGAKNKNELFGVNFFKRLGVEVKTITDDGIEGGPVTKILEKALIDDAGKSEVIACGPKKMLFKVSELCNKYLNACQVSVEEIMACGLGSCEGCAIFGGRDGNEVKHVCHHGPWFNARWIDWQQFMRESLIQTRENKPLPEDTPVDFTCHLGPLTLKSPLVNASGTWGVHDESMELEYLGAIFSKGLSLEEKSGNQMPRVCETPSGMINAIGLQYIGRKRFLKEDLPILLRRCKNLIVNINGRSIDEFVKLAKALNASGISAFEVNISCPNDEEYGMAFGKDPLVVKNVVGSIRKSTKLPLIVKLTPNVSDIGQIALAAEEAGADIISLINTIRAAAIDVWTRCPKIGNVFGGLSGPAIRPVAVADILDVYKVVKIPIIGMGGIEDGYTGAELMMAGASAIAIGSGRFSQRKSNSQILSELKDVCLANGFNSTQQLVGSMIV